MPHATGAVAMGGLRFVMVVAVAVASQPRVFQRLPMFLIHCPTQPPLGRGETCAIMVDKRAVTAEEFEEVKREFTRWQYKLGLSDWKVYFLQEPLEDKYATITIMQNNYIATVRVCTECDADVPLDIPFIAKHEALHLLVGRLSEGAGERYISEQEIIAATEEIVYKLAGLIS